MLLHVAAYEIRIDRTVPLTGEPGKGHNRWHPDIPPVMTCAPGDEVLVETRDAFDHQFSVDMTAEDVARADLSVVHPLTGPVAVEGAEEGDLLVVDVLEVEAPSFGYTVQVPGFGFLRDLFGEPHAVRWYLAGGFAQSEDLPGVRIPAAPFAGTFGVAPSRALLTEITARRCRRSRAAGRSAAPRRRARDRTEPRRPDRVAGRRRPRRAGAAHASATPAQARASTCRCTPPARCSH